MKIENSYLVLEENELQVIKKITGHSFVQLLGYDRFTKIGDCLLTMHKIYQEKVDEKWLKRGNFAEKVIQRVYKRDGHEITIYDKKEVNYDNFQDYLWYGGLIDIELLNEKTLIEVKSKSMKDYNTILQSQPLAEVYQGLYYGYLRDYDEITMEWVFFDEKTEQEIFHDRPVTSLQNLKRFTKTYKIDKERMKAKCEEALKILLDFREKRRIHISQISDKVLSYLGFDRMEIMDDDLPF